MTVYKYPLVLDDRQTVMMPEGARLLSVQLQGGKICLWAIVDPSSRPQARCIRIAGTGHPIEDGLAFIGTVQTVGGVLVWHVFEVTG